MRSADALSGSEPEYDTNPPKTPVPLGIAPTQVFESLVVVLNIGLLESVPLEKSPKILLAVPLSVRLLCAVSASRKVNAPKSNPQVVTPMKPESVGTVSPSANEYGQKWILSKGAHVPLTLVPPCSAQCVNVVADG